MIGLAWRNLWRNRCRTLAAMFAMGVGLAASLLLPAWTEIAAGDLRWALRCLFVVCSVVVAFVAVMTTTRIVDANLNGRTDEIAMLRMIGFSRTRIMIVLAAEIAMLALCAEMAALAAVWACVAALRDAAFATAFVFDDTNAQTLAALYLALIVGAAAAVARRRLSTMPLTSVF